MIKNNSIQLDTVCFKKMTFIYNALQDGWIVKKKDDTYIFTKKHENKKEIYLDSFLTTFIEKNSNFETLLK